MDIRELREQRIPRTPEEDPNNIWFEDVETFRPGDVTKEVYSDLRSAGTSRNPIGKSQEVLDNLRSIQNQRKVSQEMHKIGEAGPPLTNEMLNHAEDYYAYRDAAISGQPMKKKGYFGGPVMPGLAQGGIPPYTDPLNSQTRWGVPTWNENMPEEDKKELQSIARGWCKWYYKNHPIIPTCIDIYARYPFVGLDIQCPSPTVEDDYKSIFFDLLNYEQLLPLAARNYWMLGEAPMLGEWDDVFGGWINEEVINPDVIDVIRWPGPRGTRESYFWYPPDSLQKTIQEQDLEDPRFRDLVENFGEQLERWSEGEPSELPSDVFSLLRHDMDIDGSRGYPILMRAFSVLMREEKLNAAMTAVADRLYTPFIVVKLGSKDLLQNKYPWIPTDAEMKKMQAHMEMIMISKYRLMVYHSGIEFDNPFSGQTIPDLNADFDRATKDIMGVFGISPELIYGGSSGPYAAGALSAEIMMQNLAGSQKIWSRWWIMDRAKKIAEARGYYEVEKKGLQYIVPMERVVEFDPITKRKVVRERRKLMLPAIRMETMDFRDQENTVQGLINLRRLFDIPIKDQTLVQFYDSNLDLSAERDGYAEERRSKFEMEQQLGPAAEQQGPQGGGLPGAGPTPGIGMHPDPRRGMPSPSSRPPQSDEMRGETPQPPLPQGSPNAPGGAATQPALTTSYNPTTDKIYMVTGNFKKEGALGDHEVDVVNKKFAGMSEYDLNQHKKHAEKWDETMNEPSYAEEHMFNFYRGKNKKRGTLYFAQGNSLKSRKVD